MLHDTIALNVKGSQEGRTLTTYILDNSIEMDINRVRPIIIICPGGAYSMTSDREAEVLAIQLLGMGFHAAVLRYSCAPSVYPASLLELAVSVSLIRDHSEEWHIDNKRIFVLGCSAGGHLAASYGMFWKEAFLSEYVNCTPDHLKPNGMILCYPVITSGEFAHQGSIQNLLGDQYGKNEILTEKMSLENQVSKDTPPAFIWHTFMDTVVPVENSLLLVSAMRKQSIQVEFHLYPIGGHGLSLANEETDNSTGDCIQAECQSWISLLKIWITTH